MLPDEGTWRFQLAVEGPEGTGRGSLSVPVGPRPGPPIEASWAVGLLPAIVAVPICLAKRVVAGVRPRSGRGTEPDGRLFAVTSRRAASPSVRSAHRPGC
ncbi:hypothetical protein QFZ55_007292 [Streptomyces luteogriseus]|nr:hypothetical protein [Streptomyces luteogriseus]